MLSCMLTHMKCLFDGFSCLASLLPAFLHDAETKSTNFGFCIEHRIFESYLFPNKDNTAMVLQFMFDIATLNRVFYASYCYRIAHATE